MKSGGSPTLKLPQRTLGMARRFALICVLLVLFAANAIASYGVLLANTSTCEEDPLPADVRQGRAWALTITLVFLAPWVVTWMVKRRRALIVAALVTCTPSLYVLVRGLSNELWRGGWCF